VNQAGINSGLAARMGREFDRIVRSVAKREKINPLDANGSLFHLNEAVGVKKNVAEQYGVNISIQDAYNLLAESSTVADKVRFLPFDEAVRMFGDPTAPARSSVIARLRSDVKWLEDFADSAGVKFDKLDYPYLPHLAASPKEARKMRELMEVQAVAGEVRRTQEGFTRHRAFPTMLEVYRAGVRPELQVGRALTVRGVSGAREAAHAQTVRAIMEIYGQLDPSLLPDVDALRQAVWQASEKFYAKDTELSSLLNKVAMQAPGAKATAKEAREKVRDARQAVREASKTRDQEKIAEAIAELQVAKAELAAASTQLRGWAQIPDIDKARSIQITEAAGKVAVAETYAAELVKDIMDRVLTKSIERIREIKDLAGDAMKQTPEQAAQAAAKVALEEARLEAAKITDKLDPVLEPVAAFLRAGTQSSNAAGRNANKGGGSVRQMLGQAKRSLKDAKKAGDNAKIEKYQSRVTELEQELERMRAAGITDAPTVRDRQAGMTRKQIEEQQVAGQQASSGGRKSRKKRPRAEGSDKPKIVDWYDDAMAYILRSDNPPSADQIPTRKGRERSIEQSKWDKAKGDIEQLIATKKAIDELEEISGLNDLARAAEDKKIADELNDAFGAEPGAGPVQLDDAVGPGFEGEVMEFGPQPSDIIPQVDKGSMSWTQRQVVNLLRADRSSKPWLSVKPAPGNPEWTRIGRGPRKYVTVPTAEATRVLDELEGLGVVMTVRNQDGAVTQITKGDELAIEGMRLSDAPAAISDNFQGAVSALSGDVTEATRRMLSSAERPLTMSERRVSELEALLKASDNEKALLRAAAKVRATAGEAVGRAKARLRDARKTRDPEAVRLADEELKSAQELLKEANRAVADAKAPPNARKVASATRKRDSARKGLAQRYGALIAAMEKHEAIVSQSLGYTGNIVSPGEMADVREGWERVAARIAGYEPPPKAEVDSIEALLAQGDEAVRPSISDRYAYRGSTLDPEAAPAVERVLRRITQVTANDTAFRRIINFLTAITRGWKSIVLATPGYHARNLIDDGLRAYWAGARSPATFIQVARLIRAERAGGALPSVKIGKRVYSGDELIALARAEGVIGTGSQYHSELTPLDQRRRIHVGKGETGEKDLTVSRIGEGRVATFSQSIGEAREDWVRLSTMVELMKNGDDAGTAAIRTREFLFDYNDTSAAIEAGKAFWTPFITYSLKAVPFYARTAVQRPGQLANLNAFMNDLTQTAMADYPGEIDMSLMAPGQELSFAIPRLPFGISDYLFDDKPAMIDPSNLLGLSAINQISPITFPGGNDEENAVGAALGTIPKGLARVAGGFMNPIPKYGVETATGRDLRFGSPLPKTTRLTPVPMAAQAVLSGATGGALNLPGYGMKRDSYTGEQVPAASTTFMRALGMFPPIHQIGSYMGVPASGANALGFDNQFPLVNEADAGRVSWIRTLLGVPVRPFDVSRAQYYASRRPAG
jgi:hypothetical protein